jgi:NADPH-dependent glutamate synthase beta subunit-like oxidoreductase
MGFLGPEKTGLGVKLDLRGNVAVDGNKQTSVPGAFAAGDRTRASCWSCGRSPKVATPLATLLSVSTDLRWARRSSRRRRFAIDIALA